MMLDFGALITACLLFATFAFGASVLIIFLQRNFGSSWLGKTDASVFSTLTFIAVHIGAALATWALTEQSGEVLIPLGMSLVGGGFSLGLLKNYTVGGKLLLVTNIQVMVFGAIWGGWFVSTMPVSNTTRTLMLISYPLFIPAFFVGLFQTMEQWEVLCRKIWLRPRKPLPIGPRSYYPKVSLQVPTCSEPPELVMATLDSLANLNYPNFEVMVIDNNTKDPDLWRPLEAHCRKLGKRFRFFHIEELSGAKAGALNFAMTKVAPDAELVAVIDSDYQTDPDFLASLVGYFDDPKIGFVQTPHDYREWEDSPYLRMCYWEYKCFFETKMVSLNERDAALTVGTMCLLRRQALEEAGGWAERHEPNDSKLSVPAISEPEKLKCWAEWCATEDSELSIRIHALGYSSVYLPFTFGRGLIPETFLGYKKQRFRWTIGPVQELKRHFRLFLPKPFAEPSQFTLLQKIHHLCHGLGHLNIGLRFLLIPVSFGIVASMLIHREVVNVPLVLWVSASISLVAGIAHWWMVHRDIMRCSVKDMLGALIAGRALSHTVAIASFWGVFTREIPWFRTNKFKALPLGLEALSSARVEVALGLSTLTFAIVAYNILPGPGLHFMLIIGALYQSLDYFTAPALALLAERDVRVRRAATPLPVQKPLAGIAAE
jgi:cellulose synthase/poly-beta-1,6-N-acetylglucosamine synthase-like glycosyltransferase